MVRLSGRAGGSGAAARIGRGDVRPGRTDRWPSPVGELLVPRGRRGPSSSTRSRACWGGEFLLGRSRRVVDSSGAKGSSSSRSDASRTGSSTPGAPSSPSSTNGRLGAADSNVGSAGLGGKWDVPGLPNRGHFDTGGRLLAVGSSGKLGRPAGPDRPDARPGLVDGTTGLVLIGGGRAEESRENDGNSD